jgi:hypothetical protein
MTDPLRHLIAGRMVNASGVVTFCTCGLGFFADYGGEETKATRALAVQVADEHWDQHRNANDPPEGEQP